MAMMGELNVRVLCFNMACMRRVAVSFLGVRSLIVLTLLLMCVFTSCDKMEDVDGDKELDSLYVPAFDLSGVDSVLLKPGLRILAIGNSYTVDFTRMLSKVVNSVCDDKPDIAFYSLIRGNGSFYDWYNISRGYDTSSYDCRKVLDNLGLSVQTGSCSGSDNSLLRAVLSEEWDVVVIQQRSLWATEYGMWFGEEQPGYLRDWLSVVRSYQPKAVIAFPIIHSYYSKYKDNVELSSSDRHANIVRSVSALFAEKPVFQIVIPYGTAVELLRETSYNNEYDLTRDGTHLGYGLPCYAAACCVYETLLSRRVGKSVSGTSFSYTCPSWERTSAYPCIDIDEVSARVAQDCAVSACAPYMLR